MSNKVIEDDITVTTKGTFTLPVRIRRLLGITEKGAKLKIRFSLESKEAIISKPKDFAEIQAMTKKHIRPKKPPLTDVSGFYQKRGFKD